MPDEQRYLIVHSDEGAVQRAYNKGILRSALDGCLSSVSVCANGAALDEFMGEIPVQCPQLGMGVHVILNEGSAVSAPKKSSRIMGPDGRFLYTGAKGFAQLFFLGASHNFREEVKNEIRAQILLLLEHTKLDHLSAHFHIHMLPRIFDICLSLAEEYKIPFIRIPQEPVIWSSYKHHMPSLPHLAQYAQLSFWSRWNKRKRLPAGIRCNDVFYGVAHCTAMTVPVVSEILSRHRKEGIVEMLFHPFLPCEEPFYMSEARRKELATDHGFYEYEAISSPAVRRLIDEKGFVLTNYRELSQPGGR